MKSDLELESKYGNVDISLINDFEHKISFKFPITYKSLISKYDGARILKHMDAFNFFSNLTNKKAAYGLARFLSFNEEDEENFSTMKNYWEDRNHDPDLPFPDKIVPFAIDGGGNLICFDYRHDISTNEPKIVVWHHEGESGTAEELSFVANSFDEFLDMLHDSRSEEMKKKYEEYRKTSIFD